MKYLALIGLFLDHSSREESSVLPTRTLVLVRHQSMHIEDTIFLRNKSSEDFSNDLIHGVEIWPSRLTCASPAPDIFANFIGR